MNKEHILNRFIKYVTIDTESDPNNQAFPSTEKQWDLARLLEKELIEIGMQDVELDENCYLMSTLPSLSLIHISEPTRRVVSRMPSSA